MTGLCFCQTTRQSGEAQICPRPCGSDCQPAPEASSSKTIWPGENPAVLPTVTVFAPLTASAVRLVDPAMPPGSLVGDHRDGPTIITGEGLALTACWNGLAPLVFASVVWPGPAPRKVIALLIRTKLPLLMMKVPAASCTTWPAGQVLMAAWIRAVSSCPPPRGVSVEQTVDRMGMPPTAIIPGFHTVARSAGRKMLGSPLSGGDTGASALPDLAGSAALAATMVPCPPDAVWRPVPSTVPPMAGFTFPVLVFTARGTAARSNCVDS